MAENQTITVLETSPQLDNFIDGEIISFELEIADKKIPFDINVTAKNATLADIVPAARKLSSKIAIATRNVITDKGLSIPCRKGCSACCGSLVPVSVPEAFCLRDEMLALPTNIGNPFIKKCIQNSEKILKKAHQTSCLGEFAKDGKPQISQINKWYGDLKLTCPFLAKDICTLYEQRPLACREHIVTGSSDPCQRDRKCRPNVVPLQVSVLETLGQLASELENTEVEAIILPLAFAWTQTNLQRAQRVWPAAAMAKRFAEILKQRAAAKKTHMLS